METPWRVLPREGFAGLRLGESRDRVRQRLGDFVEFQRVVGGRMIDDFQAVGVQVTYGEHDDVEFIEVADPARPTLEGVPLVGRRVRDIRSELREKGFELVEDEAGAAVPAAGVGLFLADSGHVESVSIGD